MPEKILSTVQTGAIGKGKAVRRVFPMETGRVWGLLPSQNSLEAYKSRQFEYWRWWQSLLARAILWAANRQGDTALTTGNDASDRFNIQIERVAAGLASAGGGSQRTRDPLRRAAAAETAARVLFERRRSLHGAYSCRSAGRNRRRRYDAAGWSGPGRELEQLYEDRAPADTHYGVMPTVPPMSPTPRHA